MYPQRNYVRKMLKGKNISIAIPASVVSDTPHLREKTSKVGLIGRAAAIFGVDEIIIYRDDPEANQGRDINLIAALLSYMETPQYLRKKLFRLSPELRYAGILPPLRTPHHPLTRRVNELKVGEYRDGVVISDTRKGVVVDIGVEKPALVPNAHLTLGRRVTVKIVAINEHVVAKVADRQEIPDYWGYTVTAWGNSLGMLVKDRRFDLKIATSKYGVPFNRLKGMIRNRWQEAKTILIAFGAPAQGLHAIVSKEGLKLESIMDFVINVVPDQKTETVRTEEALLISLAVLSMAF